MDNNEQRAAELFALWIALTVGAIVQIASGASPGAVIGFALFFGFLFSPRG